jgi:hypothetical protein
VTAILLLPAAVTAALVASAPVAASARLGVSGARFTLNGKPVFLLGISYYGALGASPEVLSSDLNRMGELGFNWLRVWAVWSGFDNDVSAVDAEGRPREPWMGRLEALVRDCDGRGLVVDVTLTRGDRALASPEAYHRAVEAIVSRLRPYPNWYMDLANEHDIRDARYVGIEELRGLRDLAKALDPARLVTASNGDLDEAGLRAHLVTAGLDFISPHRPRRPGSAAETEAQTRRCLALMGRLGGLWPVHYQEPFRRGYGDWPPAAQDFLTDAAGAKAGGAAGWCLHNGSNGHAEDGRPRRSFDLREGPLFSHLDSVERAVVRALARRLHSVPWGEAR